MFEDKEAVQLLVGKELGQNLSHLLVTLLQLRQRFLRIDERLGAVQLLRRRGDRMLDHRFNVWLDNRRRREHLLRLLLAGKIKLPISNRDDCADNDKSKPEGPTFHKCSPELRLLTLHRTIAPIDSPSTSSAQGCPPGSDDDGDAGHGH